jgi:TonB family protein
VTVRYATRCAALLASGLAWIVVIHGVALAQTPRETVPQATASPAATPAAPSPAPASAAPATATATPATAAPLELPEKTLFLGEPNFPAEAAAKRLSGKAVIRADVAADGRLVNPVVHTTSGSPVLDAAALAHAGTLGLRRHEGATLPAQALLPVEFALDTLRTLGDKRCSEFITDHANFMALRADANAREMPVFGLANGVIVASRIGDFSYISKLGAAREITIATCAKSPSKKFFDVYQKALR